MDCGLKNMGKIQKFEDILAFYNSADEVGWSWAHSGAAPVAAAIFGCRIARLPAGWSDMETRLGRGFSFVTGRQDAAGYGRQDACRYKLEAVRECAHRLLAGFMAYLKQSDLRGRKFK
jgi:hypothetical protein